MAAPEASRCGPSAIVRAARHHAHLSQRAFAQLAGTSGPAVAAYESGRKDVRVATLARLVGAVGLDLRLGLSPKDRGAQLRDRRRRRRFAVAAATAAAVERDFAHARALAQENLDRLEELVGGTAAQRWVDQWRVALEAGPAAIRAILLDPGDQGDDLRQMTPFAGLLSDDARTAVLEAAGVLMAWGEPG